MLLEAGRALDAHENFQMIVQQSPTFLDAETMLGLASYLAGDGLAARAVWEELRERRPEDPRIEAYLALLDRTDVSAPPAPPASPAAPAGTPSGAEPPPAPPAVERGGGREQKPSGDRERC